VIGGSALAAPRDPGPLYDLSVLSAGKAFIALTAVQRRMLDGQTAAFGLDIAASRVAWDEGSGWVVTPGERGVCLIPGDASMTCGPVEALARGQVAMTTEPVDDKHVLPGVAPKLGPGPGKVQGVVPDGIVAVVGHDAAGGEIARADVINNVYDLRVPSFQDMKSAQLVYRDGTTKPLQVGLG
jgi:hypothetical protein